MTPPKPSPAPAPRRCSIPKVRRSRRVSLKSSRARSAGSPRSSLPALVPGGTNSGRLVFPNICAGEYRNGKNGSPPQNLIAPPDPGPRPPPQGRALLVRPGDAGKRRARSARRRFQAQGPQAHRRVAEALGGAQPPPQNRAIPLGAVDAGVLHQPRRQEFAREPPPHFGKGQGGTSPPVRARIAVSENSRVSLEPGCPG